MSKVRTKANKKATEGIPKTKKKTEEQRRFVLRDKMRKCVGEKKRKDMVREEKDKRE